MGREKLYDDLIMDHIKNARNYRLLDDADRQATGSNPLCGDRLVVQLKIVRGRIEDVGFQCECCGISMASASIMTERVRGRLVADVQPLVRAFIALLDARPDPASRGADPPQRAILATVREFPTRTRCAALPWTTLDSALETRQEKAFSS